MSVRGKPFALIDGARPTIMTEISASTGNTDEQFLAGYGVRIDSFKSKKWMSSFGRVGQKDIYRMKPACDAVGCNFAIEGEPNNEGELRSILRVTNLKSSYISALECQYSDIIIVKDTVASIKNNRFLSENNNTVEFAYKQSFKEDANSPIHNYCSHQTNKPIIIPQSSLSLLGPVAVTVNDQKSDYSSSAYGLK